MKHVTVYTDGACLGNPGPGGYAAIIDENGRRREITGAEPRTTNNRMELMAVIQALQAIADPAYVHVVTDSQYVQRGMTDWIEAWKRRGWKTASGGRVKNRDLWEVLWAQCQRHRLSWEWVRGHDGHVENERVDQLARAAIAPLAGE